MERMERFWLELRKERAEMECQEAEQAAAGGDGVQPGPVRTFGAKEFYGL